MHSSTVKNTASDWSTRQEDSLWLIGLCPRLNGRLTTVSKMDKWIRPHLFFNFLNMHKTSNLPKHRVYLPEPWKTKFCGLLCRSDSKNRKQANTAAIMGGQWGCFGFPFGGHSCSSRTCAEGAIHGSTTVVPHLLPDNFRQFIFILKHSHTWLHWLSTARKTHRCSRMNKPNTEPHSFLQV